MPLLLFRYIQYPELSERGSVQTVFSLLCMRDQTECQNIALIMAGEKFCRHDFRTVFNYVLLSWAHCIAHLYTPLLDS